ncbi:MAG TPA: response regulator transcription factor [Thermoleophilaceae bacterium]|nr:response regulator transcription factor [Thermoleophilaceae bacterium]
MRLVVGEDQALFRQGMVRLLSGEGFEVVAEAADADELVRKVAAHRPDVVVTDVRMPPTNTDDGLRAALSIRERFGIPVIVLSQYVAERSALDLIAEDPAGVGYLLKDRVADIDRFVAAVHQVAEGGSALDPEVVSRLLGRREEGPLAWLSPREREVLSLMAEGRSNQGIAEQLVITEHAVGKHVRSILQKLDLPLAPSHHRRVLAVLTHLGSRGRG